MQKAEHLQDIVVIGAGIIGINVALALQRHGSEVLVVDRAGTGAEASRGNAGAFAFSDIEPLATPGVLRRAPRWFLDPLGPLSIPPSYALPLMPWLMRFFRASLPDRHAGGIAAQAALMALSRAALERQVADTKAEQLLQREGQLQLFDDERTFRASLPSWRAREDHGIAYSLLRSQREIAAIQPGLDPRFTYAGFTPDWINTCDPMAWLAHLASVFRQRGGGIERAEVVALKVKDSSIDLMLAGGEVHSARQVVVAAGAWSHHLTRTLGERIPLETERGYNTTLPPGAFDLRTHLTFSDHGFVVSRINGGVRVGGAVELGGLKRPPDYRRAQVLLDKAARFLPGLRTQGGTQWMGFRPSLPDSLPVIGPSARSPLVIHAFGHGHLGLTQAAGTAEIVAGLVLGDPPPIDLAPFSATRF